MSLADTLEGYPDLFVSALVGDSLLAGSEDDDDENSVGGGGNYTMPSTSSVGNSFAAGFGSWKFPSYGQFNELDHDPDAANVNMVVRESQREGFFMVVGFVSFAIVPSLLWLFLPLWITPPAASAHAATASQAGGQTISLPSVIISIMAVIMWFLGVWKSRFLDSNWIMFGIETVVVLLLCVMSAYGVGLSLSYILGEGLEGVILTNMQQ
jgi:hypothetical protein